VNASDNYSCGVEHAQLYLGISKDRGKYLKVGVKPTLLSLSLLPFPHPPPPVAAERPKSCVCQISFPSPSCLSPSLYPFPSSLPSRSVSLLSLPLEVGPVNAARESGEFGAFYR